MITIMITIVITIVITKLSTYFRRGVLVIVNPLESY
jgi:hypothetical protein